MRAALLNDPVNGCQSQSRPEPLALRCKERLKKVGLGFLVHADAGVLNFEHDVSTRRKFISLCAGVQHIHVSYFEGKCPAAEHGIARIERQIHDDLSNLSGVGSNGSQWFVRGNDEFDMLTN